MYTITTIAFVLNESVTIKTHVVSCEEGFSFSCVVVATHKHFTQDFLSLSLFRRLCIAVSLTLLLLLQMEENLNSKR